MIKRIILLAILSFVSCFVFSQVDMPFSVDARGPIMEVDTVIDGEHIYLTRTFIFPMDTLIIEVGYSYPNPQDFSFNYEELEEQVLVTLNGIVLDSDNENHEPLVHKYDSPVLGEVITVNDMDYLVLLGHEFYCSGEECNSIYAMVVNTSTGVCLDINTGFCKPADLLKQINKRSSANDNVQVPVIEDCASSYSDAKWVNVDKAL